MNTIEKRKLEAVISNELAKAREGYRSRRERERNALVTKFETNQTPQVKQLLAKFVSTRDTHLEKVKALNEQLSQLQKQYDKDREKTSEDISKHGYRFNNSYRDESPSVSVAYTTEYVGRYGSSAVRHYSIPELVAHEKETTEQLTKLEDYNTETTVGVWSTGEDMAKMLKDFYKGLTAIVA